MAFKDLREFIETLEKTGDAVRIKEEVDWDLEAGAINRRVYEMSGPALWFQAIKDYPRGYSLFAGSLGTYRRVAVALGLPAETPVRDIYAEFDRRQAKTVAPVVVKKGPCKENIILGDDVDIYRLPAPMIHEGDGGRYIGTWDLVVCQDPDSGKSNWGMYRFMVHNKSTLSGYPLPVSHLGTILREKFFPKNKPMPVALVVGAEPLCHMAALTTYRMGAEEAYLAGGLRQAPVELVKCETSDLMVPAHAEIVIEGEILPDRIVPEGPFGEYPGYRTGKVAGGVFFHVKAITHRHSPILTMISLGMPPDDNAITVSMTAALTIKERLKRHGVPVTDVYMPPEGAVHLAVVGVEKGGTEVARQILHALTERRVFVTKIVVVDNDVDPFNMFQVIHALATKCHSGRGIIVTEYEGKASTVTPCYSWAERDKLKGATAVFDSTWPLEWSVTTDVPVKASFDMIYSQAVKDKVLRKWKDYGLK